LKDSISNGESSRRISQLEKDHEEDLKQKEIEIQKLQLQSAKNERIYFIVGLRHSQTFLSSDCLSNLEWIRN
jgi:hypothetical protein